MAARAARGIRLALCGPDFRNRRQAACIPRYEQPGKEGTNKTLGGLNWKETKTKVGERRQNSERASHNKAAIFLLGST